MLGLIFGGSYHHACKKIELIKKKGIFFLACSGSRSKKAAPADLSRVRWWSPPCWGQRCPACVGTVAHVHPLLCAPQFPRLLSPFGSGAPHQQHSFYLYLFHLNLNINYLIWSYFVFLILWQELDINSRTHMTREIYKYCIMMALSRYLYE